MRLMRSLSRDALVDDSLDARCARQPARVNASQALKGGIPTMVLTKTIEKENMCNWREVTPEPVSFVWQTDCSPQVVIATCNDMKGQQV